MHYVDYSRALDAAEGDIERETMRLHIVQNTMEMRDLLVRIRHRLATQHTHTSEDQTGCMACEIQKWIEEAGI